jgi:hypothetical protein
MKMTVTFIIVIFNALAVFAASAVIYFVLIPPKVSHRGCEFVDKYLVNPACPTKHQCRRVILSKNNSVNPCKPVLSLSNGSVSGNKHLYKCRENSTKTTFFAKQSQIYTAWVIWAISSLRFYPKNQHQILPDNKNEPNRSQNEPNFRA